MDDFARRADPVWQEKAEKWLKAKDELTRLQALEKQLREELIELADDQSSFGSGVKLTRGMRKGLIDYQQIPQLEHVDLERYRKPSQIVWRIAAVK